MAENDKKFHGYVAQTDLELPDIIRDIVREVKTQIVYVGDELVGMQSRVEDDVAPVVGICGMGGIGKTNLAAFIYNRIFPYFDAFCFLANASEVLKRDVQYLQNFLCENMETKNTETRCCLRGMFSAPTKLSHHKFLIVFDGVDLPLNPEALDFVIESNWFGGGSRIIITTRDERVLQGFKVDDIYQLELLTKDEALQLFCRKAFKCDFPMGDYEELTESILEYANVFLLVIV